MNNIYIYNSNFISMLNLIDFLILNKILPNNIKSNNYIATLFDNLINLDIKYDENIINNMIKKVGNKVLRIMFDVYLSNDNNKELIIYYFYKNALKYGLKIINMYNLKCVSNSLNISKYVRNEAHKYKGFVRFKELKNNILYAEIEPVNNILFLISNHFKNRLKNEYWIIKDNKRNILSIYDKKNFYIVNGREFKLLTEEISTSETKYQDLWKSFYNTIGIKSRKNDRCRMNFMPKRYWKYLIEMSDEI